MRVSHKEGNIDRGNGYFIFPHPKEDRYKEVKLTKEDHAIIQSFPPALPDIPFFRKRKWRTVRKENVFANGGKEHDQISISLAFHYIPVQDIVR